MSSSLEVRECSKTFSAGRDRTVALDEASLRIDAGQLVAVLGSNGAGKSTLLNVVSGNLVPDDGSVHVNDRDLTRWPSWKRGRYIWTIRQDPEDNVLSNLSVEENLALAQAAGPNRRGLGPLITQERRRRSAEALESLGMGLEQRLKAKGSELSGGQRQAVAVAMATVADPDVLLCDEHVAALDPRSARTVTHATQALVRDRKLACLMITHNLEQAGDLADRVVIMHQGRIVTDLDNDGQELGSETLLAHFEEATGGNVPDVVQLAGVDG